MAYDRNVPYNELPILPPPEDKIIDTEILQKWGIARAAIAKLDGITNTLNDPQIMVNTIALQEAKESSKIENIVTTTDALYEAMTLLATEKKSEAAKEVLRNRESLMEGISLVSSTGHLDKDIVVRLFQIIKESTAGIRTDLQEVYLKRGGSDERAGQRVYTPPLGNALLNEKFDNLIEYLNDDEQYKHDALIKMAVAHYQFEAIHPFIDGNGRVGRVSNVLYLVTKGILKYPVAYFSRYISHHKEDYQYLVMLGESKWGLACNALAGTETLTSDRIRWRETAGKRPWLSGMVKEKMCALIHVEAMIAMLNAGLDIKGIE